MASTFRLKSSLLVTSVVRSDQSRNGDVNGQTDWGVSFTAQALAFVLAVAVEELIANQRQAATGLDAEVTIVIDIHLISAALLSQVAAFGVR